jgi:putative transposase
MTKPAKIIAFPNDSALPESAGEQSGFDHSNEQPNTFNKIDADSVNTQKNPVGIPIRSKSVSKSNRLDQLNDSQLEKYAGKYRLVTLVKNGVSVGEAIKQSGAKIKRRNVYNLLKDFEKYGEEALIDKRWQRKPQIVVLIKEVTEIALAWYFERSAAGYRAIAELTAETCRKRNLPVPSESSVKKYLCGLPEGVKLARKGKLGLRNWQRNAASVVHQQKTTFANELWQGDHTPPEIWIKRKIKGSWEPARVHISAFLDDYSRAIPGFIVSTKYSDSWSISILSYYSIMPKEDPNHLVCGSPFGIESDCGGDWISDAVQTYWQSLGITPFIDHPYYPNSKGKVERWFRTLDSNCLRKLSGHFDSIGRTEGAAKKHVHKLLTLEHLRAEITNWVVNIYHQKVHSETGRKPIELWEETVRYRPVKEDDLNIFLLKYDLERTILNVGIRLTLDDEKHRYWSPEFEGLAKRRVSIRYNPEDMESILLYCASSGEFLCEAWDMRSENPKYSYIDIKNTRNSEKRHLQGIQVRTKEYHRNVLANDRVVEQEKEWVTAKEQVKKLPKTTEIESNNTNAVDDLINSFRRNDRNK